MSYKPFRPNKGDPYGSRNKRSARGERGKNSGGKEGSRGAGGGKNLPNMNSYDDRRAPHPENEIRRLRLFGFRSGAAWKMIPAMFYYGFMAIILVNSILGEIREFTFEPFDIVLMVLKYILLTVLLFSPAIFLSDFPYRDKLPFFKNRTFFGSLAGLAAVFLICVNLVWMLMSGMSDTYTKSADAYYQEMDEKAKERQEQMEKESKEQAETTRQGNGASESNNNADAT